MTVMSRSFARRCLVILLMMSTFAFGQATVEDLRDPQDQYMYAHGLQDRKLYDRAEKAYRDFLAANGGHRLASEAHVNLILCLHEQRKIDDMLKSIAEFRTNYPKNPKLEALTSWEADAFYQKKDYAKAAESFRILQKSKDESLSEYSTYLLAMCIRYQNGKDTDEVLDLFQTLAKGELKADRPWRSYSLYQLSWRALTGRKLEEAEKGFRRLSDNESVSPEIREASLYRLGEVCNARGLYVEALAAYERCLGLYPDGASSREVRKRRVMLLFDQGKMADALEKADDWHRRYAEANDYEMDYIHGLCLFNARRYPEARPFFMRISATEDVPADIRRNARTYVIYCLMEEKAYKDAGIMIDAFLKDYPQSPEKGAMMQHRGRIYELQGNLAEAEKMYRQALALYKGNVAEQVRSHELLISMFINAKQWQKAADELLVLYQVPGVSKPASFLLQAAECEREAKNLEAATRDYLKLIATYPQSKHEVEVSRERLMYIYSEANQLELAEEQVRELLKDATGAKKERLTLGLATILYNRKNKDAALDVLMKCLETPLVSGDEIERNMKKLASQILLTSIVDNKSEQKSPQEYKRLFDGVKMVNDLLVKFNGENLDGPFLYQSGLAAGELRNSGVDFGDFDIRACEERIWRALWNLKDDPVWSCRGGLELAKRLVVAGDASREEAGELLAKLQVMIPEVEGTLNEEERLPFRCDVLALLAENLFYQKRYTQALDMAEKVLSLSGGRSKEESTALAWLVKARVLLEVDRNPTDALTYATMCFIVGNHSTYNPSAMLLAIRSQLALGNRKSAKETWAELRKRYPLKAEEYRGEADLKPLFNDDVQK
ncbi:MAG: tetratricopeptide repeat protein [Victivallales bacterium]|nr:tetratricopeptide repeat protein [Victivallales bacterium]